MTNLRTEPAISTQAQEQVMESIVDRLRRIAAMKSDLDRDKELLADAAAVIDRLTKRIAKLKAKLEKKRRRP